MYFWCPVTQWLPRPCLRVLFWLRAMRACASGCACGCACVCVCDACCVRACVRACVCARVLRARGALLWPRAAQNASMRAGGSCACVRARGQGRYRTMSRLRGEEGSRRRASMHPPPTPMTPSHTHDPRHPPPASTAGIHSPFMATHGPRPRPTATCPDHRKLQTTRNCYHIKRPTPTSMPDLTSWSLTTTSACMQTGNACAGWREGFRAAPHRPCRSAVATHVRLQHPRGWAASQAAAHEVQLERLEVQDLRLSTLEKWTGNACAGLREGLRVATCKETELRMTGLDVMVPARWHERHARLTGVKVSGLQRARRPSMMGLGEWRLLVV
jgi:hypothetical protein